jgi:hypothetical protein
MQRIRVDIDELSEKLELMKEDDYVTTELEINDDEYTPELLISAVSFDEEEPISYGTLNEVSEELY